MRLPETTVSSELSARLLQPGHDAAGPAMSAMPDPMVRTRLAELVQEIFPRDQQTPEALGELQKADFEKWWPIIKAANIRRE